MMAKAWRSGRAEQRAAARKAARSAEPAEPTAFVPDNDLVYALFPFHPYANIFPLIVGKPFDELVRDIEAKGLVEPIVLHDGQVLDGRNRFMAMRLVDPDFSIENNPECFRAFEGDDALAWVISKNLHRRHLDTSQRALVAARLEGMKRGRPVKLDLGMPAPIDRGAAAELMNVSERTIAQAAVVRAHGAPALLAAVDRGEVTIATATEVASLPAEEQQEVVARGEKEIVAKAKEIRAAKLAKRHAERNARLEAIAVNNPELPTGRLYSVVLIDVPRKDWTWSEETGIEKSPSNHYPVMDFRQLCDFPIDRFAAKDAVIAYWSTAASLVDDLDVLAEWGFVSMRPRGDDGRLKRDANGEPLRPIGSGTYGSHQIWRKQRAGERKGMGRWFRDQHEILLLARRGDVPAPLPGTQDDSVFDAPIGEHSTKPHDHVRAWIDRCWPSLSKIEIFARGDAPEGWTFWGNQADQVDKVGAAAIAADPLVAELVTRLTSEQTSVDKAIDWMRSMKFLVGKTPAKYRLTERGLSHLEEHRAADVRDQALAALPDDFDGLAQAYRVALNRRHHAALADDAETVARESDRLELIEEKANKVAWGQGGLPRPVERLHLAAAAPIGEVPQWGQLGLFPLEIDGVPYLVKQDDWGFAVYAVDPQKPFVSDTGYLALRGDGVALGVTVAAQAEAYIREEIAQPRDHRGRRNPRKSGLALPAIVYRMPESWAEADEPIEIRADDAPPAEPVEPADDDAPPAFLRRGLQSQEAVE